MDDVVEVRLSDWAHWWNSELISLRDSRQGDLRQKKIKIGLRDVEIRVRSVRFAPRGLEKKVKRIFLIFRSRVTWAWWLVFEEPGCGGWFLRNQVVAAGFWGSMACWLVFTEPGCAGWFLLNEGALAGFY